MPDTEGVIDFDGRPGIVLERIDGVAMWERMKTDPETAPGLVGQLVDLQTEVQRTVVSGPPQRLCPLHQRRHLGVRLPAPAAAAAAL